MRQIFFTFSLLLLLPSIAFCISPKKIEKEIMLTEVNKARGKKCRCGVQKFKPAPKLIWDNQLERAAIRHAEDMASKKFLDHIGSDKSTVMTRVTDEKFVWQLVGENVAEGFTSEVDVVAGWMGSAGHCKNIMNPDFTHIGAAVSSDGKYWVQVFATPLTKGTEK